LKGVVRRNHCAWSGLKFSIGDHQLSFEQPADKKPAINGSQKRNWSPLQHAGRLNNKNVQASLIRSGGYGRYCCKYLLSAFYERLYFNA
jgi:hypothetical protein